MKYEDILYFEIKKLIDESRNRVAATVNSEMTDLYWKVGNCINEELLNNGRAEYGKQIMKCLSERLEHEYGRGWSEKQLRHCVHLAITFQYDEKFSALRRELNWTCIKTIMYIDDPLKREFYIEMCKMNHWNSRTLQGRINSMLYERTAISKKPEDLIFQELEMLKTQNKLTPDLVFHDPYFLDYLGLKDTYSERDLESAIISELQQFIIELGSDFAFMARQKCITIDNEDYYIDLLFFHRKLKCLVAIELKLGKFEAAHKGQMELYLRWLEKYEMIEGENPPIGLILCSSKNEEHIELLRLDESNIRVAEYLTKLPDMKLLELKLRQSIDKARKRLEMAEDEDRL
ncbi:MAG: PDDEXK nuclease domain-containing protein [Lachnospiraceae bacterium]|nr:PDDEXK nuclease domain-containing protein [Lachnospiraceae bacterium]